MHPAIQYKKEKKTDLITIAVFLLVCWGLTFFNLHPKTDPEPGTKERARVISVDNSEIMDIGLLKTGPQNLEIEILSGKHKGERYPANNQLRSQMELDKMFEVGDTILVGLLHDAVPGVTVLNAQDYYRIGWTALLFGLFCLLLLCFAGLTGLKALVSFVFSCLTVWKIVVPLCLNGVSPILATVVCVFFLTVVIMFLVAGWSRKFVVSCTGSMLGIISGCVLSSIFTHLFHVNGAIMPYSQALYYSGYQYLSLQNIFIGAIILASSGAVMDLGMDVAAGMEEIVYHKPDIPRNELIRSGIRIGQSVVGTMTTTLLLAYSGGYLTLMMTFAAQGTSPIDFINNPYVASEAVKTLIGSFALVLVAPFTAIAGGIIYKLKAKS